MSGDLFSDAGLIASGSAAALVLKLLWDRFLKRAEKDADALESGQEAREKQQEVRAEKHEARLESFQGGLVQIQTQLSALLERLAFSQAEFRRLDERQAGMSVNYSQRLAALEAEVVRLKTLWEMQK